VSEKYSFIDAEKADYPIVKMCAWLKVSTSGFYAWRDRPASATARRRARLAVPVQAIFDASDGTYGYRRIHAALLRQGEDCGPELVRDLMRELGLVPCQPRPWRPTTTQPGEGGQTIPDLVGRDFTADAPGTKLVGDITYLPTWQGFCYLATVIDCCTKECIGYAIADHMRAELVIDGLRMAARNYQLQPEAIFHSDHGSQYLSQAFAEAAARLDVRQSVGRVGPASIMPSRNRSMPRSKSSASTAPPTRRGNTPARMWPGTSGSATIPSDFTRRWATVPHARPIMTTRISGKRPDGTNSSYPKSARWPRPSTTTASAAPT
jgi:putative transposase